VVDPKAREFSVVEYTSIRALIPPLYAPALSFHLVRFIVVTVLPLHILAIGGTYDDVGVLMATMGLGQVITNVPAGYLVSRLGPSYVLLFACGLYVASAIFCMFSSSLVMVGIACFLQGISNATGVLARQTFLAATVSGEIRGRAASGLAFCQRLAGAIGPFFGGVVADSLGTNQAFWLQAAMACTAAAMVIFLMPSIRPDQRIEALPKSQQDREGPFWKKYARRLLMPMGFVWSIVTVRRARELIFPLAGHATDLSQSTIGSLVALSYLCDTITAPIGGQMLDRVGRPVSGVTSAFVLAAGIACLLGHNMVMLIVSAIISGLGNGLSGGIIITLGADLAPPEARAVFLGVFRTMGNLAELAAPVLVGTLADHVSLDVAELTICCISVIGGVWICGCVGDTRPNASKPKAKEYEKQVDESDMADEGAPYVAQKLGKAANGDRKCHEHASVLYPLECEWVDGVDDPTGLSLKHALSDEERVGG